MDPATWYNGLPKVTRWWFSGTVLLSLAERFSLITPNILILNVLDFPQIWRLVTGLFFYPITPATGMSFLLNLFFLLKYSLGLELEEYRARPADYAFMFLIHWALAVILVFLLQLHAMFIMPFAAPVVLMEIMVFSVMYVWTKLPPNQNNNLGFMFGMEISAKSLPWVLCAFNFIIGGSCVSELLGIAIGHTYFNIRYEHPLIRTPAFLDDFFPYQG